MFDTVDELREVVDKLTIHADDRVLAAVIEVMSTLQAKLAAAIAVFDGHRLWDTSGATSMTGWLRDHGMTGPAASRCTRVATKIAGLPVTSRAWVQGKLTAGQVEVITAHLRDQQYVDLFAAHEDGVVANLAGLTMHDTNLAMKAWRDKADAIIDRPDTPDRDRELHLSKTLDGTWVTRGSFGPLDGETVNTAMRVATTHDADGEPKRTPAQRRADALTDVCRFFLDHQHHRPAHRHRPHVNVIVHANGTGGWKGETVDRTPLDEAEVDTLVCDSIIHRYVTDDTSTILDYGQGTDTVPMGLFNAVQTRDRGCRYPGCDRGAPWCDAHHLRPLQRNGPTTPHNLVLLCHRHHHFIHRRGWHVAMTSTGALQVTSPDGITRLGRPPGALGPAG